MTPPELIRLRLPNRALHAAYTLVMVDFTLPYFAPQPRRAPFSALERWQTSYLPVYAAWALIVAAVFPIVFGFN